MNFERESGVNPEISKVEIKNELLAPFTQAEVSERLLYIYNLDTEARPPNELLCQRTVGNYELRVYLHNHKNMEIFDFQIVEGDTNNIANLLIQRPSGSGGAWNLSHRIVNTGDLGISGSEFLELAEGYLKKADALNAVDIKQIEVESVQPKVTRWLLKNGYRLETEVDEKTYQDFLENPSHYELVKVDYGDEVKERDLFLMKRSEDEWDEEPDELEPLKEISMSRVELRAQPDLVKIKLIKDL